MTKIIFILILCIAHNFVNGKLTDVVQTDKGQVQGKIIKTIHNESFEYAVFRGIPYAKPPLDQLRFQPPVEADAWTKILNATLEASSCPQISEQTGQYSGDEDCLYLNVYTPKISFNETVNDELLAVMVWIYGGGFLAGEIKENFYGPDFLVADNVVVVAMNYRLGALGFLSLDIPEATGNMGLKDQLLALKWVKKNIQKFGGDPKKVTIFGESAGSDSVMLHQLSPASRGLFRGAIGMSGSPLNPWGFAPLSLAVTLAFDFAKYLGINSSNKTQVFNEINALSAEILAVTATDMYFHSNIKGYKNRASFVPFVPTCENPKIAKDIFITESPLRTYESGKFSIIPVILGFTNEEMLSFFPDYENLLRWCIMSEMYYKLLQVDIPSISTALNNVIESKIKDIYLLDESIVFSAINITSNLNFVAGIDSTQQYLTKHSSTVFYYKNSFDYEESMHIIKGINFTGTGHADDLGHFFWQPVMNQNSDPNSRIGIHRTQIIRLWTNFVKYLNPTPSDTKDPLINFTWIPSGTEGLHLEIGNEQFVMKTRPTDETTKAIQASANAFDHADLKLEQSQSTKIKMFKYIFIIFLYYEYVQGELTECIMTDKGPVQGEILTTVHDTSIKYTSFRAIPYAKPPLGQLRFQPPVDVDAWSTTLIARSEATACSQVTKNKYIGNEDCLYLNIYTPWTSFNESKNELLAVMVWIHGGEFIAGEIDSKLYGPDFLIADNVVLVDMNYRLGALGFLSLDIPEATGNMGLKDQVLALKWIQKNIKKFGGDPTKVTLFGQSAGSVSALLHQLSPASKGLFRAIIGMSGSPLNPWGFSSITSAVAQALDVGKELGITTTTKKLLYETLQNATAEQLVFATFNKTGVNLGLPTFKPTYENPSIAKDIFLSECPIRHYESGNYSAVPIILGFTNAEILLFIIGIKNMANTFEASKMHLQSIGLNDYSFINHLDIGLVKDNYLLYRAINETTDLFFVTGIDSTQKYLAKSSTPVYYYRNSFDYNESLHRLDGLNLDGCAHADDLPHIFYFSNRSQSLDPNSRIGIHRSRMIRLWTNFAKYLDPTPNGTDDSSLNMTWSPSNNKGTHLEIGNDKSLSMKPRPTDIFVKLLQKLLRPFKYGTCPRR
ncbi:uncharacterized protein LOC122861020 [Aphidius gifuensis]|uniref:uncharacterized protein LOC122861020 n=1 Tax=Aphidius gifuensis TaxID=684658 RepID=UPI001CDC8281|nr:uncharacterized protein LOC122861020 [Aphidius gifuensis]